MAEFEIALGKTKELAAQLDGYSGDLRQQKGRVESVARQMMFKSEYRGVNAALNSIASNIGKQQKQMKQYGGMLGNIVNAYKGAESDIIAKVSLPKKIEKAADNTLELLFPLLSQFGIVGSSASALLKFINNSLDGINTKDVLGLLKGIDGLAGKIAGFAGKKAADKNLGSFLWGEASKSIFDDLKGVKPNASGWAKWKAYMKDELIGGYSFKDANGKVTKASAVKASSKYIGAALSFFMTMQDNIEEQGGVMNGRAWGETIVETGVTAAEGALVSAAVGGVAALFGGAPVLAVGVATVGVTWVIDMGYKAITGSKDGLIEDASDWICDHVKPAAEAAASWAKSTWNSVTDFFSGGSRRAAYGGA